MRVYPGHQRRLDHPQTRASNGEGIDTAMLTLIEGLWRRGYTTEQCCQDWASTYLCDCYTCTDSGVHPGQAYIKFATVAEAKRFVLLADAPVSLGSDETYVTFPTAAIAALTAQICDPE